MPVTTAAMLCLATAIYHEARGEPIQGRFAVAEVIMNRVDDSYFPSDICSVVYHDRGPAPLDCQFSFSCDGRSDAMPAGEARDQSISVALQVIDDRTNFAGGALYFLPNDLHPSWTKNLRITATYANHTFYANK